MQDEEWLHIGTSTCTFRKATGWLGFQVWDFEDQTHEVPSYLLLPSWNLEIQTSILPGRKRVEPQASFSTTKTSRCIFFLFCFYQGWAEFFSLKEKQRTARRPLGKTHVLKQRYNKAFHCSTQSWTTPMSRPACTVMGSGVVSSGQWAVGSGQWAARTRWAKKGT